MKFYFCESCGNVFFSNKPASVNCCGEEWPALKVSADPNEKHQLDVKVENGKRIFTMHHPQTMEHYFTFIAFVEGDNVKYKRLRPEETVVFEIPEDKHGKIYWHCNLHGMYEAEV